MATEFVKIPDQLMVKVKETAKREAISIEELVRDAIEQRVNGKGFSSLLAIAKRHGDTHGIAPGNVETIVESEIAAYRKERAR